MPKDNFNQRKKTVLFKSDKSFKKSWDKRIIKLCEKINSFENYYTTSSCSGRIVLMINQDKKEKNLFFKIYHNLINVEGLKKDLNKIIKENKNFLKFKMEPCILHIACRNLKDAQNLYNKAKLAGWKKSGIIATGNRFFIELNSTEKLEFPIVKKNKILVDNNFLKMVVQESNKKLKKSWEKIRKLEKLI